MWMVNPRFLCDQHLLGEHNELHSLVGSANGDGRDWVRRLAKQGYLNLEKVQSRHHKIAQEMRRRGMNHDSSIFFINDFDVTGEVDTNESLKVLQERCADCKQRITDRT